CAPGARHRARAADTNHFPGRGPALVRQLRDMDEAFLARQDLHKGPERQNARDLTCVDLTRLDFACERADPVDGLLGVLGVARADVDRAVVLDVDAGLGLLGDLANHLAAWADDVADLVGIDLDGGDARREDAHFRAR